MNHSENNSPILLCARACSEMLLGEGRWDHSSGKAGMMGWHLDRPDAAVCPQLTPPTSYHHTTTEAVTQEQKGEPATLSLKTLGHPTENNFRDSGWPSVIYKSPRPNSLRCLGSLQLAHLQPISHSFHWFIDLKVVSSGNSLTAQWLWLRALTARGLGLIPGWGTKIPQASRQGQKSSYLCFVQVAL